MNMGAAMAPAACDTIVQHFEDFKTKPSDYDKIITGDLSQIGSKLLSTCFAKKRLIFLIVIWTVDWKSFERKEQDVHGRWKRMWLQCRDIGCVYLAQMSKKDLETCAFRSDRRASVKDFI